MSQLSWLSSEEILTQLKSRPGNENYLGMYSSYYQGLVTDSQFMQIPIDDHMVHRGDGVFEAIKVVNGKPYLLPEHMLRLKNSAMALSLQPYETFSTMQEIVQQTWKAIQERTQAKSAILRVFLSRGPGNFSTNPYDTLGSQFYVVVTRLTNLPSIKYEQGVKVIKSKVPVKPSWLATVKTCNYLPNVMMKKEAVDANVDFSIGFDDKGGLAESSTENIVILTQDGYLVQPELLQILKGCTMTRVFELAEKLISEGLIKGTQSRKILESEILHAKEIMMLGTTLDVLPVVEYEKNKISAGRPGRISRLLQSLLLQDQL